MQNSTLYRIVLLECVKSVEKWRKEKKNKIFLIFSMKQTKTVHESSQFYRSKRNFDKKLDAQIDAEFGVLSNYAIRMSEIR